MCQLLWLVAGSVRVAAGAVGARLGPPAAILALGPEHGRRAGSGGQMGRQSPTEGTEARCWCWVERPGCWRGALRLFVRHARQLLFFCRDC